MKRSPFFIYERGQGVTVLVPRAEALAASEARSTEVARALLAAGYRVRGDGRKWRVELDAAVCKHIRTL